MLKRFMNWLLHRLRRLLGALSGQRSSSRVSPSQSALGDLRQAQRNAEPINSEFSLSPESSVAVQSTAPLRQSSSSALKDAVDPVADEPDTHRRLDAAAAAIPEAVTVAPSFPTEVSDLIPAGLLTVGPVIEASDDSELLKIHDLLPAIEPEDGDTSIVDQTVDQSENTRDLQDPSALLPPAPPSLSDLDSTWPSLTEQEVRPAEITEEITPVEITPTEITPEPLPINQLSERIASSLEIELMPAALDNEPAERVEDSEFIEPSDQIEPSEQVVLFSFDITESDPAPVESTFSVDREEAQNEESVISQSADAVLDILPEILPEIEPTSNKLPAENEFGDIKLTISNQAAAEIDEPTLQGAGASAATLINDLPYPWSLATPAVASDTMDNPSHMEESQSSQQTPDEAAGESLKVSNENAENFSAEASAQPSASADESVEKRGVVKLLFTLKKGNFHGYIAPDDGTKDILFHQKYINADIFDGLERGARVLVWVIDLEGKAYATRIELL